MSEPKSVLEPAEPSPPAAPPRGASGKRGIVLSGWHGHENAGDDATLVQFLRELSPDGDPPVTVLCEQPERIEATFGVPSRYHYETVGLHGLTHLLKGRLGAHFSLLRSSRLFALGGGSLMRDNTTWHNLMRVIDELFLARLLGCKTALYAVGVGPFRTRLGRFLIGRAAASCDLVTVRDENSKSLLVGLGLPAERVHVVADPGFLLEAVPVRDEGLLARTRLPGATALFPSLGFIEDGADLSHVAPLARALDALHERRGLVYVSLPMRRTEAAEELDDVHVTELVRREMRHKDALHVHRGALSPGELKWLAGQFPLAITVRLHAMIFALAERTPVVAIGYEPKVRNVLHSFGLSEWLVPQDDRLEAALVERVEQALERSAEIVAHIDGELPSTLTAARRTFELLRELL